MQKGKTLLLGQLIMSLGIAMVINANLGVFTITLFNMSLSNIFNLSFGFTCMVIELLLMLICYLFKAKIGWATIFNGLLGGYFIDFWLLFLPTPNNILIRLMWLLVGCLAFIYGTYMQGKIGLGKTSSNMLTSIIRKRTGLGITPVKIIQETLFFVVGVIGAVQHVGFATLFLVVCFGWMMDKVYHFIGYDPTKVEHKSIFERR